MTHAERCQAESTRDVVFLLQWRQTTYLAWITEGVWIDRAEAEAFRKSREYEWPHSRIYGVPADGQLAELLRRDPTLSCIGQDTIHHHTNASDFNFCPYCGRPIEIKEAP